MTRLLLTGGRQRQKVNLGPMREWRLFDQARLLELDTDTGEVRLRLEYVSPAEHRPEEEDAVVFKAGCVDGERVGLVTQTEVLTLDRESLEVTEVFSHPWFNDLHHAAWFEGQLHVVSTGLDRLLVLDETGEVVEERSALPGGTVRPLEVGVDYRKLVTTKPHASHPNYVFRTAEGTWLTRFEQRDAICLDRPELRFAIDSGKPHDGVVQGDSVWFTAVNGRLFEFDARERGLRREVDLSDICGTREPLGWCRGLCLVGTTAFVGFSRIRYTRIRENLSWVRHGFVRKEGFTSRPTRVMAFDLSAERLLGEWDLEPSRLNAVFSILEV